VPAAGRRPKCSSGATRRRRGSPPRRRGDIRVSTCERHHPARSFDREHQRPTARLGREGKVHEALPARGRIRRDFEHRRGVAHVDADGRLGRQGVARRSEGGECEVARARCVDHEIGVHRLGAPLPLEAHAADRLRVVGGHEPERTAGRLDAHVRDRLHPAPHAQLDLRAGRACRGEAEVALRERIEARPLDPNVEPDPEPHGTGPIEVVAEPRQQVVEGALPAAQQGVQVLALRDARSGVPRRVERVALEYRHPFEAICEDSRRGEARHATAHHDRVLSQSCQSVHGALWTAWTAQRVICSMCREAPMKIHHRTVDTNGLVLDRREVGGAGGRRSRLRALPERRDRTNLPRCASLGHAPLRACSWPERFAARPWSA
jgi:hypothetical protein